MAKSTASRIGLTTDSSSSVQAVSSSRRAKLHTKPRATNYHGTTMRRPPPIPFPSSTEASTRAQTGSPTSSVPRSSRSLYTIPPLPIAFSNSAKLACVGRTWSFSKRLVPPPIHKTTSLMAILSSQVDRYNALLDELATIMTDIHYSHTATEAPKQLGIHMNLMRRMNADIKASTMSTLPSMESIFTEAQENVESILRTAVYPRFVKYQMTNSASKALSTDRTKYQGLGDCFCLTDPNKADNPIVFASDGFVSVTGYSRPEVVPRNCRFLQGNYTDRTATKRLKASIEAREETVELLLNYKKTGEPFWNLLYVGMRPCVCHLSPR